MFFRKKKGEGSRGNIPIDRIQTLSQKGMADKDIIKQLKSEGYSYDEIEKGMLQAVKQGVVPEEPYARPPPVPLPRQPVPAPKQQSRLPSWEDIYTGEPEEPLSYNEPELLEGEAPSEDDISPELAIEELVEGVVNEKWERLEKRIETIEADQHRTKVMLSQMQQKKPESPQSAESSAKIEEIYKRLDEIEARIGGMEKAFKQFLPSLTRNIESLSKMVHEMKEKTG